MYTNMKSGLPEIIAVCWLCCIHCASKPPKNTEIDLYI